MQTIEDLEKKINFPIQNQIIKWHSKITDEILEEDFKSYDESAPYGDTWANVGSYYEDKDVEEASDIAKERLIECFEDYNDFLCEDDFEDNQEKQYEDAKNIIFQFIKDFPPNL